MSATVLAIGCHPDDIEFTMAGTLLLCKRAGCAIHYFNVANGSCGTTERDADMIVRIRRAEAERAAALAGAAFHPPLVDDLMVFYEDRLVRQVCAVVREVAPDILLLMSLEDYMEDHMNAARVAVTAAFARGMRNYASIPPRPPVANDVALYHAQPAYGLHDRMRNPILPEFVVDIGGTINAKEALLACHASQGGWLRSSQGVNAYLQRMRERSAQVARLAPGCAYAEGWRRHAHLGFAAQDGDPLGDVLRGVAPVIRPRDGAAAP